MYDGIGRYTGASLPQKKTKILGPSLTAVASFACVSPRLFTAALYL